MVNLKSNIPTPKPPKGPWKRFAIYLALISSLEATSVMASVDVGGMANDQILINRPDPAIGTIMPEVLALPEADDGSVEVESVEMVMLFSCWRTNYVEIGFAGCYQL